MSSTNAGTAIGRLANAPRVFPAESGAKKVLMTVMVDRNFRNRETGERDSDAIPVEAWVGANVEGLGVYALLGKGDLVSVSYNVRSSAFPDRATGEMLYRTSLVVEDLQMLEPKSVTQQRRITHLQRDLGAAQSPERVEQARAAVRGRTSRQKATAAA